MFGCVCRELRHDEWRGRGGNDTPRTICPCDSAACLSAARVVALLLLSIHESCVASSAITLSDKSRVTDQRGRALHCDSLNITYHKGIVNCRTRMPPTLNALSRRTLFAATQLWASHRLGAVTASEPSSSRCAARICHVSLRNALTA